MNDGLALLVSDECDRLLAELRSISSNSILTQVQDEIISLKLNLFTNSFQISQILSPFEKIITDEQTTDFITSLALSSVNTFISFNLLQSSHDVDSICNTIKNCQFQSTSDFDCAAVSYRILTCIISLCRTDLLNTKALLIMLDYVMTEIKNSDRNISPILIDALSSVSTYIFRKNINEDFLMEKLLTNLYFLCQCECYYRQCGLICLLQISRVTTNRNDSLMSITCSLFHKFIISVDSRDNFVLILRLFTHVFIDKYMLYPLPFSKCFFDLLNFIEPPDSNKPQQTSISQSQFLTLNYHLKRAALEVISDFISQPNFLLNLFVNLNGRTYFPQLFDKLIKVYFTNLDKKNRILKLNLPDVKILTNNQHNFYFTIDKTEITANFNSEKSHYNELLQFSEKFNENPSFFIKNSDNFYTPQKVASYLIESPNLSRKQIGEFFGKNKTFCMDTLREYLDLLDFSDLDFDSSIRLFLSGFQIAGEGQIVDRIFECFSKRFYNCSKDKTHFRNMEAVHLLAYGWLMIHTSFHNNNVTKKPVFDEFLKMMEKQNDGVNFDAEFLFEIFESVKNVKVPFEDSEQEGSVAHWRLLLCRQKKIGFKFVSFPKIELNNRNDNLSQKLIISNDNKKDSNNNIDDDSQVKISANEIKGNENEIENQTENSKEESKDETKSTTIKESENKDETKSTTNKEESKDETKSTTIKEGENKDEIQSTTSFKDDKNKTNNNKDEEQTNINKNETELKINKNEEEIQSRTIQAEINNNNDEEDENQRKNTEKERENTTEDEIKLESSKNETNSSNECLIVNENNDTKNETKNTNEANIQKEIEDDLFFLFDDENKKEVNKSAKEKKVEKKTKKPKRAENEDDLNLDSLLEEIESSINESEDTEQKENESLDYALDSRNELEKDVTVNDNKYDNESSENQTESQTIKLDTNSTDNQTNNKDENSTNYIHTTSNQNDQQIINSTNNQINNKDENSTNYIHTTSNQNDQQIINSTNNQINNKDENSTNYIHTTSNQNDQQVINSTEDNKTINHTNNQSDQPIEISLKNTLTTTSTASTDSHIPLKSSSDTDTNQTNPTKFTTSSESQLTQTTDTSSTFFTQSESPFTGSTTHDDCHVPLYVIERDMFDRIWTLESTKIIDLCVANTIIFHSVCESASKFNMTDVVDNFVMLFSKNSVEELLDSHTKERAEKDNDKDSQESSSNLFLLGSIVTNYGHSIRNDGWRSYIKLLTTLLELDLLNDTILTFKNIAEDMKPVILCHKLFSSGKRSRRNSMFSLFLSRHPSFDDMKRPLSHSNLRDFVSKSCIEKFIENNQNNDSLFSLISAIIDVSREVESGFETDQMRIAFCVILIEKVVTSKKNFLSFFAQKKVFEKITDDFFVPVLSKKSSGSFLSTLFFNEAFVIVLDLWSIKPLQIDLIYFIDKVFIAPQICQNKVQVDMIEKCLSLFFKKFFQSFVLMQHLNGVLNLIQVGILQNSKTSFLLLKKFDGIRRGDFENVRFPLIQANTAVILVENSNLNSSSEKLNEIQEEPRKRKTFSEMKPLILVKQTSEKQWERLFNEILFPLTMKRVRYDDLIILMLETFEFAVDKLCRLPLFESIWFRLLGLTLDFSRRCDADVKSQIEARLDGCIEQMKKLSIFVDENSKIWSLTKSNVERVFPSIF